MFYYILFYLLGLSSSLYFINKIVCNEIPDFLNLTTKFDKTLNKHIELFYNSYDTRIKTNLSSTRDLIEDYMDDILHKIKQHDEQVSLLIENQNKQNEIIANYNKNRRASP